jgi:hypothetical protein
MTGHGANFGRKKEEAIVALFGQTYQFSQVKGSFWMCHQSLSQHRGLACSSYLRESACFSGSESVLPRESRE